MGTRADFYIGTGATAEWLGSVAFDGYEWDEIGSILDLSQTESDFRESVKSLSERDDFTSPTDGWPWPWDDSRTTDYAYCYTKGGIEVFCFGHPKQLGVECEEESEGKAAFPDMKDRKNLTMGKRSGLIVFGV